MTAETFVSAVGPDLARYVAYKRALGRRYAATGYQFLRFDRFLVEQRAGDLTQEVFEAWCASIAHLRPSGRRGRMREVLHFCRFRRRTDPTAYVPDPHQFPPVRSRPRPHVFEEKEIARMLRLAATLRPHATSPLHAEVARLAVVLLYTTGLRRGELVRLELRDYDRAAHVLHVHRSKFGKSRLLPLSADAARELETYLRARSRPGIPQDPGAPLLVCSHGGVHGYSGSGMGRAMRRLFMLAGVKTAAGRPPRVHDFRFTFALHALLRWYRQGIDVQAKLPSLTAYMGHASIVSTQYYLTLFEAEAHEAADRFARHAAPLLRRAGGHR